MTAPFAVTGLQAAIVGGGLLGLAVVLVLLRLLPAHVDLADALARLTPDRSRARAAWAVGLTPQSEDDVPAPLDGRERLGIWAMRTVPTWVWARTPTRELAILRISPARFYGEKLAFAGLGLVIPPALGAFFTLIGMPIPVVIPVGGSLALAAAMFFIPNYNAVDDAKAARVEFNRALGAYIDLVALERNAGSGARQAMELAAAVGDSWVFQRLNEELARSRWSGLAPWDALRALAVELGLPELDELADIMRLGGEHGAQVYETLRARSSGLRSALLNAELAKANEMAERMSIPMSFLGVIFMGLLVAPALLRIVAY